MKLLITGARSSKTFRLPELFKEDEVVLGDYGEVPVLKIPGLEFITLGECNKTVIAHNLLTKCLDHGIEAFLPLHEYEARAVAGSIQLFAEFDITVLLPEASLLDRYINGTAIPGNTLIAFSQGIQTYPPTTRRPQGNLSGVFFANEEGKPASLFLV